MKRATLVWLLLLAFALPLGVAGDTLPDRHVAGPLPIRMDQEGNTCVIFAVMHAMAAQDYRDAGNRMPVYDWRKAWSDLKALGLASDLYGSDVRSALGYVRDVGLRPLPQARERVYRAWRDGRGGYVRRWSTIPKRPAVFGGAPSRIAGFEVIQSNEPEAIKAAIISHGPVVLSLGWDLNWAYTLADGRFKEPVGKTFGHAVVLYGWATDAAGETWWYVANSYGEMWGLKGTGRMPDKFREKYWWYVSVIFDRD